MGAGETVLLGCFSLASGSSGPVRIEHGGGATAWITGTLVAPSVQDDNSLRLRSGGAIESFSSLWQLVSKGPAWLGSFSIARHIRHLKGHPLWGLSLLVSCWCWHVAGGYSDGSTPHMTQQYCLASMAAQLSSKGIRHHNLLPHIPSGHLPTVNDRPHSANALQFLSSSSQMPCVPGDLHPCLGYGGLQQGLSLWFLPHSNCHRSVAALYNSPTLFPFVLNNCCAIGV